MDDGPVHIDTDGDRVAVRLVGDVDMANAAVIGTRIDEAISNRAATVDIDLAGVTYFDSAGLRLLSLLATRLKRLQIQLRVVAPAGSTARRVIDLAGVADHVRLDVADGGA